MLAAIGVLLVPVIYGPLYGAVSFYARQESLSSVANDPFWATVGLLTAVILVAGVFTSSVRAGLLSFVVVLVIGLLLIFFVIKPGSTDQEPTASPTSASENTPTAVAESGPDATSKATALPQSTDSPAPGDKATAVPRDTPTPVSRFTPTPVSRRTPTSVPARPSATSTSRPTPTPVVEPFAPIEATPRSVSEGFPPLVIAFVVESVERDADTIQLNITITRIANTPLRWGSDEGRKNQIFLRAGSSRYELVDMGGIFTQDTTLQPDESYDGWFTFEMPDEETFTFNYPDVEPIEIELGS